MGLGSSSPESKDSSRELSVGSGLGEARLLKQLSMCRLDVSDSCLDKQPHTAVVWQ